MNDLMYIYGKSYVKKYQTYFSYLGPNNEMKLDTFLLTRLIISILLFTGGLLFPKYGIFISVFSMIAFYNLYTYFIIHRHINKRKDDLYDEAILFITMLKLAYNSSRDLKLTMEYVSSKCDNSLSLAFRKSLENHQYDSDREVVFLEVINTLPNLDVRKALFDIKENVDSIAAIDNVIERLKKDRIIQVRQFYQYKPFILILVFIVFSFVLFVMAVNAHSIVAFIRDFLSK